MRVASLDTATSILTVIMSTITAALPLTTTFVPPSTCISDTYLASSGCTAGECAGLWMNLGPGPQYTGACLPSGYSPYSYYSPGVCPLGYSIAYSSVGSGDDPETFATCCPSYVPFSRISCLIVRKRTLFAHCPTGTIQLVPKSPVPNPGRHGLPPSNATGSPRPAQPYMNTHISTKGGHGTAARPQWTPAGW